MAGISGELMGSSAGNSGVSAAQGTESWRCKLVKESVTKLGES